MSKAGVETIRDAVQRIDLVIKEDRLSLEQLKAIEEIFQKALAATQQTIRKASQRRT